MARINTLTNFLTDVADAIRTKTGESGTITPANFDTKIASIKAGYEPTYVCFAYYPNADLTNETANLDTSNITNMNYMFTQCTYLNKIDTSKWDTSKVTNMQSMFAGCSYLTSVDLSSFTNTKQVNISYMFNYCTRCTHIDIRNFDFTLITQSNKRTNAFGSSGSTGVPDNCEIIVKDNDQKSYITTNFSRLTNVKTVAEYNS